MKITLSTFDWVVFPALVVLAWAIGASRVDPLLLPSPLASMQALVDLARDGILWHELVVSLRRVFLGVILGVLIGAPFGFVVAPLTSVRTMVRRSHPRHFRDVLGHLGRARREYCGSG